MLATEEGIQGPEENGDARGRCAPGEWPSSAPAERFEEVTSRSPESPPKVVRKWATDSDLQGLASMIETVDRFGPATGDVRPPQAR